MQTTPSEYLAIGMLSLYAIVIAWAFAWAIDHFRD